MAKILLAEDDEDLSEVITFALKKAAHIVQQVYNGRDCLDFLATCKYDLIILDWMMPFKSGIEVCKSYRQQGGNAPILMLTAKTKIEDREEGLDTGADDYLTKPFDQRELTARVRALLRRPDAVVGNVLQAGNLSLNTVTGQVLVGDKSVHLRPKEFTLLEFLLRHPNQSFTTEALLQRVWLEDGAATPSNLKTHIKLLRKKLDCGDGEESIIKTVRGRGYLIEP
ncbi:MAG: response regulator transcription factor [Candidatus Obscuribacterales bacterium]|nr:response regulator transcription factor [Candidatus Obscuribacterales bacterium]